MSDKSRAPGPPSPAAVVRPVPTGRAPTGVQPVLLTPTANPVVHTAQPLPMPAVAAMTETPLPTPPTEATPVSRTSQRRPADVPGTSITSVPLVSPGSSVGGEPSNSPLSGRPADVPGTSTASTALVSPGSSVGEMAPNPTSSGRPADVPLIAPKHAFTAGRIANALQPSRQKKPKAELDDRGRYRHTLRLTPQNEQKLHEIAESIGGVDLNAAIAICITTYHQLLAKRSKADG